MDDISTHLICYSMSHDALHDSHNGLHSSLCHIITIYDVSDDRWLTPHLYVILFIERNNVIGCGMMEKQLTLYLCWLTMLFPHLLGVKGHHLHLIDRWPWTGMLFKLLWDFGVHKMLSCDWCCCCIHIYRCQLVQWVNIIRCCLHKAYWMEHITLFYTAGIDKAVPWLTSLTCVPLFDYH